LRIIALREIFHYSPTTFNLDIFLVVHIPNLAIIDTISYPTATQNMSNDYNETLDAYVKQRLNLVQNDAHPCMQKGLCKKGLQCPFIGLPNDTCLFYLTDECRFGNKCRNTHYDEYAKIYKNAKEEFKKMLEENRSNAEKEIKLDKQWLDEHTRVCPTCVIPVEKIDGCPSMSCPSCRTQFNWDQMQYATGAANLHKFEQALKEGANLRLQPPSVSKVTVIVVGLTAKRYFITLTSSNVQVEEIIKEMATRTKIPVEKQRLLSGGKELKKEKSITEYGIKNGSTIFLVLRLPGGSD